MTPSAVAAWFVRAPNRARNNNPSRAIRAARCLVDTLALVQREVALFRARVSARSYRLAGRLWGWRERGRCEA